MDDQAATLEAPVTQTSDDSQSKNRSQVRADCCIVGGGPAGVMLGLLLARQGVKTLLLEAHQDFNRDFRGDTIHPSTLDLMDQLGLTERLLEIKHAKMRKMTLMAGDQSFTLADLGWLKVRHPFVAVLPQARFLEFVADEARKYSNFTILMGARAEALVEQDGVVQGVRYETSGGQGEALAHLTVAADGRGSRLAKLAGLEPVKNSPPMDVYWFTLPRQPEDEDERLLGFRVADGKMLVLFGRYDAWQVGYVMFKGHAKELQAEGIESFQRSLRKLVPEFGDRVQHFRDWRQARYLTVESSRVPRWYRPGLLLIGDSAHVMSPVGGVGINYAIQDAVAAANLGQRLKSGEVGVKDLAAVQARREWSVRFIQGFQTFMQNQLVLKAMDPVKPFKLPLLLRIIRNVPLLRSIIPRIVAYGVRPESIR